MWKYVTRRFKDTVERTYNVLDVRRSITYTTGKANEHQKESKDVTNSELTPATHNTKCELNIWTYPKTGGSQKKKQSSFNDDEKFGKHFYANQNGKSYSPFTDALTWVTNFSLSF